MVIALAGVAWFIYALPNKAEDLTHALAYIVACISMLLSIVGALSLALKE